MSKVLTYWQSSRLLSADDRNQMPVHEKPLGALMGLALNVIRG